jgi:hypothetical protein
MGGGSGTLAATTAVAASNLGFARVGDMVCSRFRPVIGSLSIVFEKPNEALNQMVASLPLVSASVLRTSGVRCRRLTNVTTGGSITACPRSDGEVTSS